MAGGQEAIMEVGAGVADLDRDRGVGGPAVQGGAAVDAEQVAGRPAPERSGPAPRVNDRYIRRSGLPNVQPGDRAPDDHSLDLRRALERTHPGSRVG
jgi:hypothetical protein